MGLATRLSRGWRSRIKYLLVALVGGCLIVVVILSLGIVGGGIQPKRGRNISTELVGVG